MLPILTLWGERFSPRRAETSTGLALSHRDEAGEIADKGRYAGQPRPFGGAFLEVPSDIAPDRRLVWLIEAAERHLPALRQAEATVSKFHLDVRYWDQCHMEFRPDELARIASLGIPFTITCWDSTGEPEPNETN